MRGFPKLSVAVKGQLAPPLVAVYDLRRRANSQPVFPFARESRCTRARARVFYSVPLTSEWYH